MVLAGLRPLSESWMSVPVEFGGRARTVDPMRRILTLGLGLLLTVGGLAIAVLGAREVADVWARDDGPTVTATVTDLRIDTDRVRGIGMEHHEVRYLFDVGGVTYSPGDASGRTDLYVAIDEPQWSELSVGGPIEVTHDPADPANNRPLAASGSVGDAIAAIVFGLLLAGVGALVLLASLRRSGPTDGGEPSDHHDEVGAPDQTRRATT
jgi:hypothetical protein